MSAVGYGILCNPGNEAVIMKNGVTRGPQQNEGSRMRLHLADDSGIISLIDCSAYAPFVGDWEHEQLLETRFSGEDLE